MGDIVGGMPDSWGPLGEQVRKHLELEPDHSSNCVLQTRMYASNGRWNDVLKVRESINEGKQKPEPAQHTS